MSGGAEGIDAARKRARRGKSNQGPTAEVREHILEGIEQAERGEFAELSPEETQRWI